MMRKNLLITGGAGFIGGNFVQYMLKHYPEYTIYNVDVLSYAGDLLKHSHLEESDNYHFIKADIADREKMMALFSEFCFDYVVHFAAESHVDRSIVDPEVFVRTNVLGTQVLLDASKKYGVSKFVHVSTDEVYGEMELNSTELFHENTPLQPNSPYSASKASSDLLVRSYHETFGMPVVITRCSNNYGPYQYTEKLIPLVITKALNDEKIPVYGDGKNVRDWLHVYDHCSALDVVLHSGQVGEVYNIGGNNERTNLEVVRNILSSLGKSEELITYVDDRLGHDKRYAIDPSKIEKLGWKPRFDFDTGIVETIKWYQENEMWCKKIVFSG
ncbi:spore coat protein [Alkalihalobacillus macyae]|uniref:dTDP-glucose 4,6-dehydratase n=2 Tax=Guptibacillus hwajinpoensis TaxID=208199 RepID=A0A0J6CN72_9BACL|nr:dTDP-glucose 4,6-dehydratase [Alkalihalobacillus macyae]KMM37671.1 spore coat protein [Alkalihalobacillus macyae]